MPDTIYLADPDDAGEFGLARLISRLGVSPSAPATFFWDGTNDLASAWNAWIKSWFVPVLAPAFVEIYRHASVLQPDEITAVDLRL